MWRVGDGPGGLPSLKMIGRVISNPGGADGRVGGQGSRAGSRPAPVGGVPLTHSPVLVHVGLARTGTTWLQKHVFANSPHIFTPADPSLKAMERAKQLARRLCKDERERAVNELDFDIDGFRRPKWFLIAVPAGKAAVISSERLSGSVLSGGFDRAIIARRIKAVFPKARILLVIREQRALLMSMYIQYLKYGGWNTIGDFVDPRSDGRLPCFSPSYLMYDRLIGLYQDTFGPANVLVLPYEKFAAELEDYVGAICAFAGCRSCRHFRSARWRMPAGAMSAPMRCAGSPTGSAKARPMALRRACCPSGSAPGRSRAYGG